MSSIFSKIAAWETVKNEQRKTPCVCVCEIKGFAVCLMMRKAGATFVVKSLKASAFLSERQKKGKGKRKRHSPKKGPIFIAGSSTDKVTQ